MRLPDTSRRMRAALAELRATGCDSRIVDAEAILLMDEFGHPFVRYTLHFEDDGQLTLDSIEAAHLMLQAAVTH